MASNASLDRALGETLSDIKKSLSERLRKILDKNTDNIRKEEGLHKLIERSKELDKQKSEGRTAHYKRERELEEEIAALDREIDSKDGFTTTGELSDDECRLIDLVNSSYHKTRSQVKAAKQTLNTNEARNYLNFLKLETNTRTMYDLAITAKEKRNIIFALQARDWRSLGVDVPQLPHFEKFEIMNGEIKLPTTLLIESGE